MLWWSVLLRLSVEVVATEGDPEVGGHACPHVVEKVHLDVDVRDTASAQGDHLRFSVLINYYLWNGEN